MMGVVRSYQLLVSPHFPSTCRFQPTCSTYAMTAFREYGAVKGGILTVYRLGRCHPWGGHGYDPPRWFGEEAVSEKKEAPSTAENAGRDGAPVSPVDRGR